MYDIEELNRESNWLSYVHGARFEADEVGTYRSDELVDATARLDRYIGSIDRLRWSEPTREAYRESLEALEAEVFAQGLESPGYVREAYVRKLADAIGPERTGDLMDGYVSGLGDAELAALIGDEVRRGAEVLGIVPGSTGAYPPGRSRHRSEYRDAGLSIAEALALKGGVEQVRRVIEDALGPETATA